MQRIAIVDYGMCNLDSVLRAVEECGSKGDVTTDPDDLAYADKIILPGVGAFPDAMRALRDGGLADALIDQVEAHDVPLLGICLGMQLLARRSDEVERCEGLGLLDAEVVRFVPEAGERVPHVGWNEVTPCGPASLFNAVPPGADFYFVHSFHMQCSDPGDVAATAPYCGEFVAAVERGPVFGTQFHPEKSQTRGLRLLRSFLEL